MQFILQILFLLLMLAIYRLLSETGRGQRLIRFSRLSTEPADSALARLEAAMENTGGTFAPVEAIVDTADGAHTVFLGGSKRARQLRIRRLQGLPEGSMGVEVISVDGVDAAPGREMVEIWTVEPAGSGSRISVEQRLHARIGGVVAAIFGAWSQLRAFVRADRDYAQTPSRLAPPTGRAGQQAQAGRRKPLFGSFDPRDYAMEIGLSLVAFALTMVQFDFASAVQLTIVILLHEYGHYLSFRLMGKAGNRIMLLPFVGGLAVSASPHRSEFERAFTALAGPAICVPLSVFCIVYVYNAETYSELMFWMAGIGYFSCVLNALNLLPIYPLDGGQVAEGYVRSFMKEGFTQVMMALALAGLLLLVWLGYSRMAVMIAIFGLPGLLRRGFIPSATAMSPREALFIGLGYVITLGAHGGLLYWAWGF
jgi:Zn-dependent protease